MSYRFTNTDKWTDSWFSELSQLQMLLFLYLCDNCDIAGFIEINYKRWAFELKSSPDTIEGALKGLQRGLTYSTEGNCVYVRNFLKHQKNYPLKPKNMAHLGILRRFELYADKFDITDIDTFIEGASKGLPRGTGNTTTVEWKKDFNVYKNSLRNAYKLLVADKAFISEQEKFNPNVDIKLSLEKSCTNFWATEAGWKWKIKKRINDIDWKATLTNSIDKNKVYKQREKEVVDNRPDFEKNYKAIFRDPSGKII